MSRFDPYRSWLPLEERAAQESSERRRALVTEVRNHMEYEIKGQLEPLMGTLTEEPIYHFWGNDPTNVIEGRAAVTTFYEGLIASGMQRFEVVVERIVVDDHTVVTDGRVRQVYPGATLRAMGVTEAAGVAIADDSLLMSDARLVTVWPADAQGKLIGEDIYFGENPMSTLTPITADDIPDWMK